MINSITVNFDRPVKQAVAKIHQLWAGLAKNWTTNDTLKVLFITEDNAISKSQIYPFYFYKKELKNKWGVEFREVGFEESEGRFYSLIPNADVVFFQPWFKKGEVRIVELLQDIRKINSTAKIIFLDVSAPLDIRYAKGVEPFVDLYLKKQLYSNYSDYKKPTQGDTNLVEYYNSLYNLPEAERVQNDAPLGFENKLILGPSFFTSCEMLPVLFLSKKPVFDKKTIDVHARLAATGSPWYQKMREHSLIRCKEYETNSIITSSLVSKTQYWKELRSARICFSPFGYGEVCWRDYEAIMSGAMLIKPDMSHIKMDPNIFIPFVTYVPISWDFSDLPEKISHYLEHDEKREEIVNSAYDVLHEYVQNNHFLEQLSIVFKGTE